MKEKTKPVELTKGMIIQKVRECFFLGFMGHE